MRWEMGDVGGCKLSYRPANRLLAEDRERPPVKGSHKIARVTFLLYHPPVFPPTLSIYLSSYTSTYYDATVYASFLAKLVQSCEYTYYTLRYSLRQPAITHLTARRYTTLTLNLQLLLHLFFFYVDHFISSLISILQVFRNSSDWKPFPLDQSHEHTWHYDYWLLHGEYRRNKFARVCAFDLPPQNERID